MCIWFSCFELCAKCHQTPQRYSIQPYMSIANTEFILHISKHGLTSLDKCNHSFACPHIRTHTQECRFRCISGEATTRFYCIVIQIDIRLSKEFICRCRECRCNGETQINWNIKKKVSTEKPHRKWYGTIYFYSVNLEYVTERANE